MVNVAFTSVSRMLSSITTCKRAAVASETSLLLPLLTSLLLGIFEFGTVIYAYSAMQFGANRVARTVAVNRMSTADAAAAVRNYVPGWARSAVAVTVSQSNAADPNISLINVQLSVEAQRATPLPLLTRIAPWTLRSTVVMKQELPYVD